MGTSPLLVKPRFSTYSPKQRNRVDVFESAYSPSAWGSKILLLGVSPAPSIILTWFWLQNAPPCLHNTTYLLFMLIVWVLNNMENGNTN